MPKPWLVIHTNHAAGQTWVPCLRTWHSAEMQHYQTSFQDDQAVRSVKDRAPQRTCRHSSSLHDPPGATRTSFMRKGHQGRAVALCMENLRDLDSMYAEYKVKADSMTMHRMSPAYHYVQIKSRTSQHEASIWVVSKAHQKLVI